MNKILKISLKGKYHSLNLYSDYVNKFDGKKVWRFFTVIVVLLCLAFIFLGANYYTIFTNNEMINNEFLELEEKSYKYSDIKKIFRVSNYKSSGGEIYTNDYYVFLFENETMWESRNKGISADTLQIEIVDLILKKTKVEIEYLDFYKK